MNANWRPEKWQNRDVTKLVLKSCTEVFKLPSDVKELVTLPCPDPVTFCDPESFREAYWRAEMWSKFPFNTGVDREAVAKAKFREYESRCAETNGRLYDLWSRPIPERVRSVLREAQASLEFLFRGFSLDEVIQHVTWSPGASTSMPRARATPQNKWVLASHITEAALPYFYAWCAWSGWVFSVPTVVPGNKVTTVPKNAKTDRTIAIEPDWNMFFQLGVGGAIRSRLQRHCRLLGPTAQEVNKHLARSASLDGFLATIDLAGASDTVSLSLVDALVPHSVKQHLFALRSPHGDLDGESVTYEKISSMGNGFTFELETALFWAICSAASGHACVYGDDIVVPSGSYDFCKEVLEFCGFEVNTKKSHYGSSPFRESCGGHFFSGHDVTPPYVRDPVRGVSRIALANRISSLADNGHWRWGLCRPIWDSIVKGSPRRLFGPKGVDGVFHVEFDRACPRWSRRYQCFSGERLVLEYVNESAPWMGAYRQALFGSPGFSQWQKPPGRPVFRYRTWCQHWQEHSSWASLQ